MQIDITTLDSFIMILMLLITTLLTYNASYTLRERHLIRYRVRYTRVFNRKADEKVARDKHKELMRAAKKDPHKLFRLLKKSAHLFVFHGTVGGGKTLTANGFAHYLTQAAETADERNRFRNIFFNKELLKQKKLAKMQNKVFRLYANISLLKGKLSATDAQPYITQLKKLVEGAIVLLDEFGATAGKDTWQDVAAKKANELKKELVNSKDALSPEQLMKVAELVRYIRQWVDGYIIMTEQDKENFWIRIRAIGFAAVWCKQTFWYYTKHGKFIKSLVKWFFKLTPAITLHSARNIVKEQLFIHKKIILSLSLILPFSVFKYWYILKADAAATRVKYKHIRARTLCEFNGKEYYVITRSHERFDFNTRGNKNRYDERFKNA